MTQFGYGLVSRKPVPERTADGRSRTLPGSAAEQSYASIRIPDAREPTNRSRPAEGRTKAIQAAKHICFPVDRAVLIKHVAPPPSGDNFHARLVAVCRRVHLAQRGIPALPRSLSACGCKSKVEGFQERREKTADAPPTLLQFLIVHVLRRTHQHIDLVEGRFQIVAL